MIKLFFRNMSRSFCIHLLTLANLIYAVQTDSFDWLLVVSVLLALLSVALNLISAIRESRAVQ